MIPPNASGGSPINPNDKAWGIGIILTSILGVCCGLGLAGLGGAVGALGAGAITRGATPGSSPSDDLAAGAGFGLVAGIMAFIGIAIFVCSAIQVAGGIGVMKSQRWGFTLTLVLSAISILLNLGHALQGTGVIGILISGAIAYYCWARLAGKMGAPPV